MRVLEGGFVMEELDLSDDEEQAANSRRSSRKEGGKKRDGKREAQQKKAVQPRTSARASAGAKGSQLDNDTSGNKRSSSRRERATKATEQATQAANSTPATPARRQSQGASDLTRGTPAVEGKKGSSHQQHTPGKMPKQQHPGPSSTQKTPTSKTPASTHALFRTPRERVDSSDADTSFEVDIARRQSASVAATRQPEDDAFDEMAQLMESYQAQFDELMQEA